MLRSFSDNQGKPMDFEGRLRSLKHQVEPLERFIHAFASTLETPNLEKGLGGFRYRTPDIRHFCLLKSVRAVSAFNAAIELCRLGFTQEICVLLRTVVECTSHIDFVFSSSDKADETNRFIADYFADCVRNEAIKFKKPPVRQGDVHAAVGAALDEFIGQTTYAEKYRDVKTSKLYSRVYLVLSNYVHCRYPEAMDLYGGIPGKYHLQGMRRTPKDLENIEILETYFTSVSQCLQLMVLKLNLAPLVDRDSKLAEWMRKRP